MVPRAPSLEGSMAHDDVLVQGGPLDLGGSATAPTLRTRCAGDEAHEVDEVDADVAHHPGAGEGAGSWRHSRTTLSAVLRGPLQVYVAYLADSLRPR